MCRNLLYFERNVFFFNKAKSKEGEFREYGRFYIKIVFSCRKVQSYNVIQHIGLEKLFLFVMCFLDLEQVKKYLNNFLKNFVMQLGMPQ